MSNDRGIVIPEFDLLSVPLEVREVLGDELREDEATALNRVSLGRAEPIRLTPEVASDAGLRDLRLLNQGRDYWLLAFTCSFTPDDEPVLESRLAVRLVLEDADGAHDAPVVEALDPERLFTRRERTRTVTFGPSLTAGVMELGGGVAQSTRLDIEDAYVVATGKEQSIAQWYFRRRPAVELEGMHDLRMVVRGPGGRAATAQLRLSAKIRRKFAGVVPYRASLPADLSVIRLGADEARRA